MTEGLAQLIQKWQGKRILVVGDLILDKYVWADVSRILPEAAIESAEVRSEGYTVGGAANVAHNITTIGGNAILAGVVGKDPDADLLLGRLRELGIETRGIVTDCSRPTTIKTRIIAHNQQVLRVDREDRSRIPTKCAEALMAYIRAAVESVDGVVLSDYGKGVLTEEITAIAIRLARLWRRPIVVDPKGTDYQKYLGASIVSPNLLELEMAKGGKKLQTDEEICTAAAQLLQICDPEALVVTRGKDGITVYEKSHAVHHIRTVALEVVDVSGAGDTVTSTLILGRTADLDLVTIARLATAAAGVVVKKIGTAAVSSQELESAISSTPDPRERKLVTLDETSRILSHLRNQGRVIVFTNGCYDLLHIGHISCLQRAKRLGDILVVGLNSDECVRALKGVSRPLVSQDERQRLVAALDCVDFVVILDDLTPRNMIASLRPDILVKGSDYTMQTVEGQDIVESYGGRVELVPIVGEKSTTKMIAQIVETHQKRTELSVFGSQN